MVQMVRHGEEAELFGTYVLGANDGRAKTHKTCNVDLLNFISSFDSNY